MARSHSQLDFTPAHRSALGGLARAVVLIWALLSLGAFAAVISLSPPTSPGELRIPVIVQGVDEEALAGVQFDVRYDPSQYTLVAVTPGAVATEAGKEVVFSETIPGQGRVLITGFNNTTLTDGQVATLVLRPLDGVSTHEGIGVTRFLATDPDGNSVPLDYEDLYGYAPLVPEEEEPEMGYPSEETDTGESPEVDGQNSNPMSEEAGVSGGYESNTASRSIGGYYPGGHYPGGSSGGDGAAHTRDGLQETRRFANRALPRESARAQSSDHPRAPSLPGGDGRMENSGVRSHGAVPFSQSAPRTPSSIRQTPNRADDPIVNHHRESGATVPPGPRLALGGPIGVADALGGIPATALGSDSLNPSPLPYRAISTALLAPVLALALLGTMHYLLRQRRGANGWRKKR